MPIHSIQINQEGITLSVAANNTITIPFNQLPPGNRNAKAEALRKILQNFLDTRTPLDELPDDDPDKYTDPALPCHFWLEDEDNPGVFELCSRPIEVVSVAWDQAAQYYVPAFNKVNC